MNRPLRADDPPRIGPFRLIGVLGGGGMGRVYLGRSPQGRTVAVKTARPELADDPHFRRRFAREVAAAQQVTGAFTAEVVAADPTADTPWMATGYVPGMSLTDAVSRFGPLPPPVVRLLVGGLVRALLAIHAAGLVHRDLKPSNVLLAPDGPRVIDFGIAHSAAHSALTHTQMSLGTPGYMAPEQVSGSGPPVTGAADVFALGAVVAYAATGSGPYGAADPQILLYRTVHEEPRLAELPDGLRPLAARCLVRDPAARPGLPELARELGPHGDGAYRQWLPGPVSHHLLALAGEILGTDTPDDPDRAADGADQAPASGGSAWPEPVDGTGTPATLEAPPTVNVSLPADGPPTARPTPEPPPTEASGPTSPDPPAPEEGGRSAGRGVGRRTVMVGLSAAGAVGGGGVLWLLRRRGGGAGGPADTPSGRDADPFRVSRTAPLEVITFDGAYDTEGLADPRDRYRERFPGARVALNRTQNVGNALRPRLSGGHPPDLFENVGPDRFDMLSLVRDGRLTELTALLDAPSVDDPDTTVRDSLRPGTVDAGRFRGRAVHGIAHAYNVVGIWYSDNTLRPHGWSYPATWDEMLAVCRAARRRGLAGWTFAADYPVYLAYAVLPFIGKIGGTAVLDAIDNLESGAWRHPAVRDALDAYSALGKDKLVLPGRPGFRQAQQAWAQGKALFLPEGSWLENETKPVRPAGFRLSVAGPSGLDRSDRLPFGTVWGMPSDLYAVPKRAPNAAGAQELLRIMLGRQAATGFTARTGTLSCVAAAGLPDGAPSGVVSADRALRAAGSRLLVNPRLTDWYPRLGSELGAALSDLVSGEAGAADTVRRIQRAADALAGDDSVPKYRHG
ncbi:hypothetical protein ACZ90_34960 [Streptomyces albus subsp. albus]|nr:hypothetical protein ACZ90_34960 [Streptomyces albus subsp. albus]